MAWGVHHLNSAVHTLHLLPSCLHGSYTAGPLLERAIGVIYRPRTERQVRPATRDIECTCCQGRLRARTTAGCSMHSRQPAMQPPGWGTLHPTWALLPPLLPRSLTTFTPSCRSSLTPSSTSTAQLVGATAGGAAGHANSACIAEARALPTLRPGSQAVEPLPCKLPEMQSRLPQRCTRWRRRVGGRWTGGRVRTCRRCASAVVWVQACLSCLIA